MDAPLFLIHWSLPMFDQYVETWRALVHLQASGRVRSIGVSNSTVEHLERLFRETDLVLAVNQLELHPEFAQDELRAFHAAHGILTQAWGLIGQGKGLLENPRIAQVATSKKRTPAQIVLRWHLQETTSLSSGYCPDSILSLQGSVKPGSPYRG